MDDALSSLIKCSAQDVAADTDGSPRLSHRETDEHYRGEVFRHENYRVAECRDGLQWLFQRQRPRFPAGGAAWDTLGYCATKTGLRRLHRLYIGGAAPEIDALPECFPRGCGDE